MTVAIIICAGEATRWNNHTGQPKHLIAPEGERLLDRTVRLARAHGAERVLIVSKPGDTRYESAGAERVDARLNPDLADADKFLSSRHLWNTSGRTVVLYGDVFFTDSAMATIMGEQRRDWLLFCRPGASMTTGARSGECFAVSCWPEHHDEWEAALRRVAAMHRAGAIKRCGGWETYRAMAGGPHVDLRRHRMYGRHVLIDDWTEDFDKPSHYDVWLARRRQKVSVLVPWRAAGDSRTAAWRWVRDRWAAEHPTWEIVEGHCPDGPWSKGLAIRDAAAKASGDLFVVADADVWTNGVAAAVDVVRQGTGWAVPHSKVHRLDETSTARVLAGGPLAGTTVRRPYLGFAGGGMFVLRRETLAAVPPDPRFLGWGQEDQAVAVALTCLAGQPWRGPADLWHLWHTPAPRLDQLVGSHESRALLERYQKASRSPQAMRALIAEFQ